MNVQRGRDVRRPASEQPLLKNEIATVGLPDLIAGGVTHICATIFCDPEAGDAHPQAVGQFATYQAWADAGLISLDRNAAGPINAVLLIEGADCVRSPEDLHAFYQQHARVIGLAWRATRYAGGTGTPGPLTSAGRELVREIDALKMTHDASHLAEQSFWDLLKATDGPVIASHSNCRAIVGDDPNERHLTDDMIRAIVTRGGVVGINVYDKFLLPASEYGRRRATLDDVVAHVRRVCDIAGDTQHVGIGTDMDGGLGREQIPIEIESSTDLPKLTGALSSAGFSADDIRQIVFGNWQAYFHHHLDYTL